MITWWLAKQVKRQTGSLWVELRWLEPMGHGCWQVAIHKLGGKTYQIPGARSSYKIVALWRAYTYTSETILG